MIIKDGSFEQSLYFLEKFLNELTNNKILKLTNNQEKILWVVAKYLSLSFKNRTQSFSRIGYPAIARKSGVSLATVKRAMKFFYKHDILENLNRATRAVPFLAFGNFAQNVFIKCRKNKPKKQYKKQEVKTNWCQNDTLVTKLVKDRSNNSNMSYRPPKRKYPETYFNPDLLSEKTKQKEKAVSEATGVPIYQIRQNIQRWSNTKNIVLGRWDVPYCKYLDKQMANKIYHEKNWYSPGLAPKRCKPIEKVNLAPTALSVSPLLEYWESKNEIRS